MGNSVSFLQAEKKTWIEHTLTYDHEVREASLKLLDSFKNDTPIFLCYKESTYGNITFNHWFVTDKTHFFEFGGVNLDIYNARVNINNLPRSPYITESVGGKAYMNEDIRNRMGHVLGISNYSLCLRNCEHVANYVFRERWISSQMDDGDGTLMKYFRSYILGDNRRQVNAFPALIRPHVFGGSNPKPIYKFATTSKTRASSEMHFKFNRMEYYLDYNEKTYNMLIIGPTGAGKSHLINVLFNRPICDAEVSHRSVTRDISFIRGQAEVYNIKSKRYETSNVVVADTVGLCDTDWDDKKIINLIKGRISANVKQLDFVVVVFKADRLERNHVNNIKEILKWLNYHKGYNSTRFLFVGTHADYLDDNKKNQLRIEAKEMLGLAGTERRAEPTGKNFESLVYVGFPPEDTLNSKTAAKVLESWLCIRGLVGLPSVMGPPISISNDEFCNIL